MLDSSIIRCAGRSYLVDASQSSSLGERASIDEASTQAVGVQSATEGGITLTTKKTKHLNRPAANKNEVTWGGQTSGPKSVTGLHQLF